MRFAPQPPHFIVLSRGTFPKLAPSRRIDEFDSCKSGSPSSPYHSLYTFLFLSLATTVLYTQ
jgi:hypothetical protein